MNPHVSKRIEFFLISLLTFFSFLILFVLRGIDDNRLISWLWTFSSVNITGFSLIIILGIIFAYIFTRRSFPKFSPSVFLFLLSFISVMPFWRAPEVIVDASRYFTQAKHLDVYGIGYFLKEWGRDIVAWTDLPLIPFLYGLIFKLFGESRAYIQIFTTFLFSMTVVLTYLIGKELWDEDVGFYGGLLLLGIPYLFTQVPLMLVDVPAMFFLTFAIYTFIKALKRGGSWIPLASFAIFLVFYAKYSAWLMLSVLGVIFLVYLIKNRGLGEEGSLRIPSPSRGEGEGGGVNSELLTPNYIHRGALIVSIAALLMGIVFWYKFDVFSEQLRLLISYQKPGLRRWEESFISTFFFQIHPFITVSALYSVYAAFKKKDLKYAIIVWLVLLVVMLGIKRIRYIIMVFPMLTLMASYGLKGARDKAIKRFVASCIIVSSIAIAMFAYLPFLQRMSVANLKEAGHFLNTLTEEDVVVFTLLQEDAVVNPAVDVSILDLYTDKRIYFEYHAAFVPPREAIERSPLRFTWEYKNPAYYENRNGPDKYAVVLISSETGSALPGHAVGKAADFHPTRVFSISEGVFQHKTFVTVYQADNRVHKSF